ncbi:MAG: hypothetical protein JXA60_08560 [Candidatus Coatesbacteria bacterium]|nr:hypothetical protein [Candidatus Coatesbacteria bacterium]
MKKSIILIIMSFLSTLYATKYAGEFLSYGIGARTLGMGGGGIALNLGTEALYWNPASLGRMQTPEILAMHCEQFGGLSQFDFIGFSKRYKTDEGIGIGLSMLSVPDIPYTELPDPSKPPSADNRPYISKYVTSRDFALNLGYSRYFKNVVSSKGLVLGATFKGIYRHLGDDSAYGGGFDLGMQFPVHPRLVIGTIVKDCFTTPLIWSTGKKEIIVPSPWLGFAYRMPFIFGGELTLMSDTEWHFENRQTADQFSLGKTTMNLHYGIEYLIKKRVALRAGSDEGVFTAGSGIYLNKIALNYAFLSDDDFNGSSHRISGNYFFK